MSASICTLVSTRPDIIKMTPVIKEFSARNDKFTLLHSGQHYSHDMDAIFFEQLGLREPDHRIPTRRDATHGQQTAHILEESEAFLLNSEPDVLLVYGDTNSTLAGALAARKLNISVGHIEAGLRSEDWRMPEEHNRVMVDHISDLLFAPTRTAAENLRNDAVRGKIEVTGNPVVDILHSVREMLPKHSPTINGLDVNKDEYILVTCHREENVDDSETLSNIVSALQSIIDRYKYHIIFPVHPRTEERLLEYDLSLSDMTLIEPVGYIDFLHLQRDARLILTDSGGVQEEACIIGTPCVTIRETTERPETVEVGANIVAGVTEAGIRHAVSEMLSVSVCWDQPFGDGSAATRIARLTTSYVK